MLNLGLLATRQVRIVGFTRQGVDNRRLRVGESLAAVIGEQVIDQPRGGAAKDGVGIGEWSRQVAENDGLGQIRHEAIQHVAQILSGFAHYRRAYHHAQNVEFDRGLVAIGVADQTRLQHAVVVGIHRDPIA